MSQIDKKKRFCLIIFVRDQFTRPNLHCDFALKSSHIRLKNRRLMRFRVPIQANKSAKCYEEIAV
jgi:hypothetical protein